MTTTTLGRSGLSRIAFGTWQTGGHWGRFDEDAAVPAIPGARDLGVNFFDTAQAVDVAIVGARQVGHLDDSVRAVDVSLTDSDLVEIETIMADATLVAGPPPGGMP